MNETMNDMNEMKRYNYRYLGEGFKVSNDTRETHLNNNDLIVGSSGSSKTGSIVYAQLKSLKDSSLVVVDTKGRLAAMFKDELKNKGYKVRILDFVNPYDSCVYNPLKYIRKVGTRKYREQDIAKVARALLPDSLGDRDPFWVMSARTFMEFLISYTLAAMPVEDHNMYTVFKLYCLLLKSPNDEMFKSWVRENPNTLAAKRYVQMKATFTAEKTFSSICAFVNIGFAPFDYEEYQNVFNPTYFSKTKNAAYGRCVRRTDVDIAGLGREKTVVFLNISDSDHSMDSMVNLFYAQTIQTLMAEADKNENGQLQVPVRIIMDDFAAGAIIPDFDKLISVVRSRDIWLTLCIQSFTQLESLYSHTQALTVVNNCDHIVYLGGNDLSSAEFIGTRAEKTPEAVLCMDRDKEYILEAGKKVKLVKKIPSYQFEDEKEDTQIA